MKRWCEACTKKFQPTGKFNDICNDCKELSFILKAQGLNIQEKYMILKLFKENYLLKNKVIRSFKNLSNQILNKQLWHIDTETKEQYMVMRLDDLKPIIEEEIKQLEVEVKC